MGVSERRSINGVQTTTPGALNWRLRAGASCSEHLLLAKVCFYFFLHSLSRLLSQLILNLPCTLYFTFEDKICRLLSASYFLYSDHRLFQNKSSLSQNKSSLSQNKSSLSQTNHLNKSSLSKNESPVYLSIISEALKQIIYISAALTTRTKVLIHKVRSVTHKSNLSLTEYRTHSS